MLQSSSPKQVAKVKVISNSRPVPSPPLVSGLAEHSEELVLLTKSLKAAFKDDELSARMKNIGIFGYKLLTGAHYDIFGAYKI